MEELTEALVVAAFKTAGLEPVAKTAVLASVLTAQFDATERAFAKIPFDVEPGSYVVVMRREAD